MRYRPEMRDVLLALQSAGQRYGAKLSAIRENDGSNALVSFDVVDCQMNLRGMGDCLSHMRQVILSKFADAVEIEQVGDVQEGFMTQENGEQLKRLWLRITENALRPGHWSETLNEGRKNNNNEEPNQTFRALTDAGFSHLHSETQSQKSVHHFSLNGKNLHGVLTGNGYTNLTPSHYSKMNDKNQVTDVVRRHHDHLEHHSATPYVDVEAERQRRAGMDEQRQHGQRIAEAVDRYEHSQRFSITRGKR
jgi:hypothetical protein